MACVLSFASEPPFTPVIARFLPGHAMRLRTIRVSLSDPNRRAVRIVCADVVTLVATGALKAHSDVGRRLFEPIIV